MDHRTQIFGIQSGRQRGGICHVAEHYADLATFGGGLPEAVWIARARSPNALGGWAQRGGGIKQPATMTDRGDNPPGDGHLAGASVSGGPGSRFRSTIDSVLHRNAGGTGVELRHRPCGDEYHRYGRQRDRGSASSRSPLSSTRPSPKLPWQVGPLPRMRPPIRSHTRPRPVPRSEGVAERYE